MPGKSKQRKSKGAPNRSQGNTGQAGDLGIGNGGAATPPALDKVGLLGHVVWLMTQSGPHKHVFLNDLEWLVMPALALGQFRIWHQKDPQGNSMPVAYASWAFLNEDAEGRIKQGTKNSRPPIGSRATTSGLST